MIGRQVCRKSERPKRTRMVLSEDPEMSTGDSPFEVPGFISKQVTGRTCSIRVWSIVPFLLFQIMIRESSAAEANLPPKIKRESEKCHDGDSDDDPLRRRGLNPDSGSKTPGV